MNTPSLPSFSEIAENMDLLPDTEARFHYLIDLSKRLPDFPEEQKVDDNRVWGCQSSVWLLSEPQNGKMGLRGISDSVLVSGIVAIVISLFNGLTAEEALQLDAPGQLKTLNLEAHLSASRQTGLSGMIEQVRKYALAASAS